MEHTTGAGAGEACHLWKWNEPNPLFASFCHTATTPQRQSHETLTYGVMASEEDPGSVDNTLGEKSKKEAEKKEVVISKCPVQGVVVYPDRAEVHLSSS